LGTTHASAAANKAIPIDKEPLQKRNPSSRISQPAQHTGTAGFSRRCRTL